MLRHLICGAALGLLLAPATARADVALRASSSAGRVHLDASASPGSRDLQIREIVDNTEVVVASSPATDSPYALNTTTLSASPEWNCRQDRVFVAVAAGERSTPVATHTPSCADRLRLLTARRVLRGENLRTTVEDAWRLGGIAPRICVTSPVGDVKCVDAHLPSGEQRTSRLERVLLAGRWTVRATYGAADVVRVVDVVPPLRGSRKLPRILVTGDSMILGPNRALQRALPLQARIVPDVYVGSGITRPWVVDWALLPSQQVAAYQQDATVISLGMVDYGELDIAGGTAPCCGAEWTAAYATAVRRTMLTFSQGGRAAVIWLNEPFRLDPASRPRLRAVNAAIRRAATGLRRVRVLDVAALLTPDETFRRSMLIRRRGRQVRARVRAPDGIHMSAAGSRLVTETMILPALVRLGVLDARHGLERATSG